MLLVSDFIPLWIGEGLADGRLCIFATWTDRQRIRNVVGLSLQGRCHSQHWLCWGEGVQGFCLHLLQIDLSPTLCWLRGRGETPYCSNATVLLFLLRFCIFFKINVSLITVPSLNNFQRLFFFNYFFSSHGYFHGRGSTGLLIQPFLKYFSCVLCCCSFSNAKSIAKNVSREYS